MDAALTWEIISRLSSANASNHEVDDNSSLPPFFAQREEKKKKKIAAPTSTSADADASVKITPGSSDDLALFLTAYPIRSIHDANDNGCNNLLSPAQYSREAITNEFLNVLRLHLHHGRISSSEMCMWLGMEEENVELVGSWLCQNHPHTENSSSVIGRVVCNVYNPMKQQHEYALVENLRALLRERINCHLSTTISSGEYCPSLEAMANQKLNASSSRKNTELMPPVVEATVMTKQMAQEMELTCEDIVWLMEGMNSADASAKNDTSSSNSRIGADRTHYLEKQVQSGLSGVTVPTSLESLFGQEDTAVTIISTVKSLCQKGMLHGVLSTPSSSSATSTSNKAASLMKNAIYTPLIYSRSQRKIADSFYETNGYLTEKKCVALGLSRSRMEKFVKESFPNAVLLTDSIIDPNKICRPLEHIVQDAIINRTFADLKSNLPDDIASSEEDVTEIIKDHLATLLQEQPRVHNAFADGLTIINGDMVLFFCKDMVEKCKELLIPLVDEFCKRRSKEITNEQTDKIAKQELVPLLDVAAGVGEKYPDLLDLQHQHHDPNNHAVEMNLWSVDERNDATNDGPLVEFCRRALFSDELQRLCTRSVKAEVDRLNSTRHGVSVSSRSEGAAKIQDIGDSFESSFRTLCHLLQLFSKSLDTLGARTQQNNKDTTVTDLMVDEMKHELLMGCGSCLARLITEYCLFKHAGEMEIEGERNGLFFESHGEKVDEMMGGATPSYFHSVNMATLGFPFFVLKCRPDENGNPQSPLKYLRSMFPGSTGLSLSQIWSLCSENGKSEDNNDNNEAGKKLELFIRHLSETCLTLVGIPFSVLDKKTEKKVLAVRREGILDRLEHSQDEDEVVMCAIVLIYHQVKNVSIAGIETINLVMTRLFEQDKKIPRRVTEALRSLKISTDYDESSSLIAQVKKFGSAKNSKALAAIVDDTE